VAICSSQQLIHFSSNKATIKLHLPKQVYYNWSSSLLTYMAG
jgi:hypothetical protein